MLTHFPNIFTSFFKIFFTLAFMRYFFIIITLLPYIGFSQDTPPRRSSKIEIMTPYSDSANYIKIKRLFAQRSVDIYHSDSDIYIIKSGYLKGKGSNTLYFYISCLDSAIYVTGYFHTFLDRPNSFSRIRNTGMKGSMENKAWIDLQSFSRILADTATLYYRFD